MSKHTPGPWRYEPETGTIRSVPANYWLATMDSFDGAVNHHANALLIEAAPEMWDALTAIVARINGEFDNPALLKYGPLETERTGDVMKIARSIIKRLDSD